MNSQSSKTFLFFLALILFSLGQVFNATAENTIQCHCFTKRVYNPAEKFEADDYILATSFNSLLAKLADLPKKQIVMIKMKEGVAQADLLTGFKIAKITGQSIQDVLALRNENKDWADILVELPQQEAVNKDDALIAIKTGASAAEVSDRIADDMIAEFYRIPPEEIKKLRTAGLNEKEITLVLILSHVSEVEPEALGELYRNQGRSWSEIANNLGVQPKTAGKLILDYPSKKIPAKDQQ